MENVTMGSAPSASEVRDALVTGTCVPGRVSIVIPVYQGERFILGAIASALRQSYPDFEVLVIDDGSSDATPALLRDVNDPRVTVLHQSNQGLSAARNTAIARASGEFIAFLDADDRWFPSKLDTDIATLTTAADPVGFVYGWYYAVDAAGRLLHRSRPYAFAGSVFDTMLGTDDFILPSASLFHRRVFEEIGGFDIGTSHEDRVFFLKAAKRFPLWPTRQYSVVYLQSIEGLGRRKLSDYETARHENVSIVDALRPLLSTREADVLRDQQLRSLYFRFLMYGFNASATRMLADIDVRSLRHGPKGWLAWLFAKSRINLMYPLRLTIQGANRLLGQRRWREALGRHGLALEYH